MCSIVILRQSDSEWPIIIGANRDEMIERQSLPPGRHWDQQKHITAGKDVEAGGTWFGVNDYGLVAAVLNRMDTLGPLENKRSRGELVLDALPPNPAKFLNKPVGPTSAPIASAFPEALVTALLEVNFSLKVTDRISPTL